MHVLYRFYIGRLDMVLSKIYTGFFSTYKFTQDLISACPGFTQKSTEIDPSKQRKKKCVRRSGEEPKSIHRSGQNRCIEAEKNKRSIEARNHWPGTPNTALHIGILGPLRLIVPPKQNSTENFPGSVPLELPTSISQRGSP